MSWKDILVHLDSNQRTAERVAVAIKLAKLFGSRLTGLFAEHEAGIPALGSHGPGPALREAARSGTAKFLSRAAAEGVLAEADTVLTIGESFLTGQIIRAARHVDLVLLGQHDAALSRGTVPPDLGEQIILNSGRPVMVIPSAGTFRAIEERPLIAWNGSREAARAVHDAMPLLERGRGVVVLTIDPPAARTARVDEPPLPVADLRRHLETHGIHVSVEKITVDDVEVMDLVLSRATDLAATLLVQGAHGQYGFPFFQRGAGTRYVLAHMTLPVLMAH